KSTRLLSGVGRVGRARYSMSWSARSKMVPLLELHAAQHSGDVFTSDDGCIIDDVFPRGASLAGATSRDTLHHLDAAVDARSVPCPCLLFEPRRDAPGVHFGSRRSLNDLVRSCEN